MEESLVSIKEICKKYDLGIEESEYERRMASIVTLYVDKEEKDADIKKEVAIFLMEAGLCSTLKLGASNPKSVFLSDWVKSQITFCYSEDKIQAQFYEYPGYALKMVEKQQNGERFEGLVEQQVVAEYELKKIFYKEEAEKTFVQKIKEALQELASDLNNTTNYDKLTEEIYKEMLKRYDN